MKRFFDSRMMLILSMIIFGTLGPFVRQIAISSGALALCRAILAAALIGLFLLFTKQKFSFAKIRKELILLLLSGAAMGFNWILLFEAYKYTTVSVATLTYYFAPVLVILVCPLLFKERMGAKQWICFGMSTLGIILITGLGNLSEGANHLLGILFGLGAACLYATVILLNKFIKNVGGIPRTFLQFLAAILVLIPYVCLTGGISFSPEKLWDWLAPVITGPAALLALPFMDFPDIVFRILDPAGWICLLIVGLIHTGVTYCLYFTSLKDLPGQKAAILSYIDPLVAVLLSVTLLGEKMEIYQIIGGLLILGFTLWNELDSPKK